MAETWEWPGDHNHLPVKFWRDEGSPRVIIDNGRDVVAVSVDALRWWLSQTDAPQPSPAKICPECGIAMKPSHIHRPDCGYVRREKG